MDERLPKRLTTIPILEATAEVRFSDEVSTGAELLVGGFFHSFRGMFTKSERLPLADLPAPVRRADVNLRYAPIYRLQGNGYAMVIGDRSIAISVLEPYPGWTVFRQAIGKIFAKVTEIRGRATPERLSLKYVNLLTSPLGTDHLRLINLALQIGDAKLTDQPTTFRTEIADGDFIDIVQVVTQASAVTAPGSPAKHGLVVEVDVISKSAVGDLATEDPLKLLDIVHLREKRRFFSILSRETLNTLGPEY